MLWDLKNALSDTGPNSISETSDNLIVVFFNFLIGNCLRLFKLLYDLSILSVKSLFSASRAPAGSLTFSLLRAVSTSEVVKLYAASFIGSIQTLTLNSLKPPVLIRPTFLTLENWSIRYLST